MAKGVAVPHASIAANFMKWGVLIQACASRVGVLDQIHPRKVPIRLCYLDSHIHRIEYVKYLSSCWIRARILGHNHNHSAFCQPFGLWFDEFLFAKYFI